MQTDLCNVPPAFLWHTIFAWLRGIQLQQDNYYISGLKFFHQRNLYIVSPIHFISYTTPLFVRVAVLVFPWLGGCWCLFVCCACHSVACWWFNCDGCWVLFIRGGCWVLFIRGVTSLIVFVGYAVIYVVLYVALLFVAWLGVSAGVLLSCGVCCLLVQSMTIIDMTII
jgi:hypothetical protein